MAKSEIAKLFVTLGLEDKEFQSKIKGLETGLKNTGKAMTGIGAAITGAFALSIKTFADAGDEIQKVAIKTGFTTEALSELKYAADLSGTSLDTIETAAKKMSMAIIDASQGTKTAVDAFSALGIKLEDLQGLTPEEQFLKISGALANIDDQALKTSLAVDLFGKSGTDLLPMLAGGAEGLEKMRKEARDLGLVFDQEAADSAAAFNDSLTKLKGGMQGVMNTIGQNLVPVLIPLIEKVQNVIKGIADWMKANPGLSKTILIITAAIGGLFVVLGPILMMLPMIAAGFNMLLGPVGLVIIAIMALVALAVLIVSNWSKITDFFKNLWEGIKNAVGAAVEFLKNLFLNFHPLGLIIKHWDSIVAFFTGLWDKVKEAFKVAWEWIKNMFLNYHPLGLIIKNWDTIVGFFKGLWDNVKNVFKGAWDGIVGVVSTAINFLLGLINTLIAGFEKGLNFVGDALRSLPSFTLPSWIPLIGGKEFRIPAPPVITLPRIPLLDTGGIVQGPGVFAVGAGVKEVVRDVGGGGINIYIAQLSVREEADVGRIARELERLTQTRRRQYGVA